MDKFDIYSDMGYSVGIKSPAPAPRGSVQDFVLGDKISPYGQIGASPYLC